MFDIKMVTTDKNNRRSGLGTDLLRRSVQLAASLGYKVRTKGRGRIRDALYCIDIRTPKDGSTSFIIISIFPGNKDRGNRSVLEKSI